MIFKVIYTSEVYSGSKMQYTDITCFYEDINQIKIDFGLSKKEIVDCYYNIAVQGIKNSVVKSIQKYTEDDQQEKRTISVHFA